MKNKEYSVYATNKGGMIKSPKGETKGDPKSVKISADTDLRTKRRA